MLHNFNSCNFKKNYFLFMAIFLLAGTAHSERKMVKRQKRNPPSQVQEAVHDIPAVPEGLLKIRKAYKNLDINVTYNKELKDWCMHFSSYGKEFNFIGVMEQFYRKKNFLKKKNTGPSYILIRKICAILLI